MKTDEVENQFPIEKSFIEKSFPVKEVSEESAREKNIRHGHISTLHIMVGKATFSSISCYSLCRFDSLPSNDLEWEKTRQFIIQLSKWENSLNYL